jgi:hypothetical protein
MPMPTEITRPDFDALVARSGIPLTPAQVATLHAVFGGIEAMQKAVRQPVPGPAAEPATTFSAEAGR